MATRQFSRRNAAVAATVSIKESSPRPAIPKKRGRKAQNESAKEFEDDSTRQDAQLHEKAKPPPKKRRKKPAAADLSFPLRYTSSPKIIENQRQWVGKPFTEETLKLFPLRCAAKDAGVTFADEQGFDRQKHVVPHGCYLVNLANPDPAKWQKSYDCFLDEIQRAEQLGIKLFNFHPGSTTGACSREEGIALIAKGINDAHQATSSVCILLENMAGKGNMIGPRFEDLKDIIALIENKSRIGVCFDTCHAFAAGYDIRTPESYALTLQAFDDTVGLSYLKALHFNDSKGAFKSHRDLHQNIGAGDIGLLGFANFMADPRLDDLPFILETPMLDAPGESGNIWQSEIALLYELERVVNASKPADWPAAVAADEKLQALFKDIQTTVKANKKEKENKAAAKGKKRSKAKKEESESLSSDSSS